MHQILDSPTHRIAEQERGEFVARDGVAAQRIRLGKAAVEAVLAADQTERHAVFVEAFAFGTQLDHVPAANEVQVRLETVGVVGF